MSVFVIEWGNTRERKNDDKTLRNRSARSREKKEGWRSRQRGRELHAAMKDAIAHVRSVAGEKETRRRKRRRRRRRGVKGEMRKERFFWFSAHCGLPLDQTELRMIEGEGRSEEHRRRGQKRSPGRKRDAFPVTLSGFRIRH